MGSDFLFGVLCFDDFFLLNEVAVLIDAAHDRAFQGLSIRGVSADVHQTVSCSFPPRVRYFVLRVSESVSGVEEVIDLLLGPWISGPNTFFVFLSPGKSSAGGFWQLRQKSRLLYKSVPVVSDRANNIYNKRCASPRLYNKENYE